MLPFGEAWNGSVIHKRSDTLKVSLPLQTTDMNRIWGEEKEHSQQPQPRAELLTGHLSQLHDEPERQENSTHSKTRRSTLSPLVPPIPGSCFQAPVRGFRMLPPHHVPGQLNPSHVFVNLTSASPTLLFIAAHATSCPVRPRPALALSEKPPAAAVGCVMLN